MRYALISDIHANLQAWNAVLLDIRSLKADQIICLGDIVGYGPNPSEVLEAVHANVDHIILGNHDAVACGKMSSATFYDEAAKIIQWTELQLNDKAKDFLRGLPLTLASPSFRCAHGEFATPGAFNYIIDPNEAMPSWQALSDQLLFVGHTHEPAIHVLGQSGIPHKVQPQDFQLEEGKRYIVNVGSVGQPRDHDARASYCVYDTQSNLVMWRRIPFDIDAYRQALHIAGISEKPSHFLRRDPRANLPPVRELISFAPAAAPGKEVKDAVQVRQITALRHRLKSWQRFTAIAILAGLISAGAFFYGWRQDMNQAAVIQDPTPTSINCSIVHAGRNLLTSPSTSIPAGSAIPGWTVKLGDKAKQSVKFDLDPVNGQVFTLSSDAPQEPLSLMSPNVTMTAGKKMCLEVLFKKSPSFTGTTMAAISITRQVNGKEELIDPYVIKAPTQIRQGGWILAKQTFELPANAVLMRLHIRGTFTGAVSVKDLSLETRE